MLKGKLLECGHWEVSIVHPRLVICMSLSILVGFLAAGLAVGAGWSLLWALPIYSIAGAAALVATTLLASLVEEAADRLPTEPQAEPAHA